MRGTKIKKGFDISLAIINGRLSLFEFDLEDYSSHININNEVNYENLVSEQGEIPLKNKRETFRILKEVLESQKNLSESLKFKTIEKNVLLQEFQSQPTKILETINLWLNSLSNRHGQSYGRALSFILVAGWIFFYFSLISTKKYNFESCFFKWDFNDGLKLFIEYLNPLHKYDYIDNVENLSVRFYIFDFLGKTFVGYGIYQFIQAFRKYK